MRRNRGIVQMDMRTGRAWKETFFRAVTAAGMVFGASGIVRVYGLEDIIFFNKEAISLALFLLGWHMAGTAWRHWHEDRRDCIIAYVMALGMVFTEVLGTGMRTEVARGGVNLGARGAAVMAAASLVLAVAAEPCFFRLLCGTLKPGETRPSPKDVNRIFFTAWGILFAGYVPCILAFYPGLYCYDMIWQWSQFDSWGFTTHHPLIHTLMAGGMIELGKAAFGTYSRGLFLHSVVQTLFLTGTMAFAIRFLVKRGTRKWAAALTGAFFLLFPFFPVLGISTTKDTAFGGFFLMTFTCICDMVDQKQFYRGWPLAGFVACSVFMCLFRNNAIYGLAVMACCLLFFWIMARIRHRNGRFFMRAAGLTLLCMVLSQGMFAALEKGLKAEKGSKAEMLSLPMQQMARAYVYHKDEFSLEDREEFLYYFDESWVLRYKYYVSDPVKAGLDMSHFRPSKFIKLWAKLGRQFPGEYIRAPLYNMMGLWYMGGDSSCYMEYDMSPPFDEEHEVEIKSRLPWLKDYYSWFTDSNIQKHLPGLSLFFYTSFYSWCVAIGAAVMWAKRKYLHMILPLFLACYGFTLVFGPCIIIRYFMGIMMCIPILAVMAFESAPLKE